MVPSKLVTAICFVAAGLACTPAAADTTLQDCRQSPDPDKAIAACTEMTRREPKNPEFFYRLGLAYGLAYKEGGGGYYAMMGYMSLQQALKLDPHYQPALDELNRSATSAPNSATQPPSSRPPSNSGHTSNVLADSPGKSPAAPLPDPNAPKLSQNPDGLTTHLKADEKVITAWMTAIAAIAVCGFDGKEKVAAVADAYDLRRETIDPALGQRIGNGIKAKVERDKSLFCVSALVRYGPDGTDFRGLIGGN